MRVAESNHFLVCLTVCIGDGNGDVDEEAVAPVFAVPVDAEDVCDAEAFVDEGCCAVGVDPV